MYRRFEFDIQLPAGNWVFVICEGENHPTKGNKINKIIVRDAAGLEAFPVSIDNFQFIIAEAIKRL